jgi:type II secretory pathway pseudopilin PulG
VVLLEAIVAMTILAIAGAAVVALATDSARAIDRARVADVATAQASAFLDAVALWPREDLDRHLGDRGEGAWRLIVDRPTATLYTVSLADSTGTRLLLHTVLYRPAVTHDVP